MSIIDRLRLEGIEQIPEDSAERFKLHREILAKKPLLQYVFREFHNLFHSQANQHLVSVGIKLEIGAGVSPIRDSFPETIASDIEPSPLLDLSLDATAIPFANDSVAVIYGQNCFHHFPDPIQFFNEADRVLKPGGGIILLEPYYGPFAGFIFRRLFQTETFDKNQKSWNTIVKGPMVGANQALSYIIFNRDRATFERTFPNFEIVCEQRVRNYFGYLLSGGLNFRALIPFKALPFLKLMQSLARPFDRLLCLHYIITIRKIN